MTMAVSFQVEERAQALLSRVSSYLARSATRTYLVGGFLRDALLGRASPDVDLAVAGDAVDLARGLARELGGSFVPLGEAHQVARVVLPGYHLDLASLRGSLEEDLAARDFTINALALPLEETLDPGKLADPLGGQVDLEARLVRATGDGVFQEDPARLLRAVRHVVTLDFTLDEATGNLIRRDHALLAQVAPERSRDELVAILSCPGATASLRQLDSLGLLTVLFPELEAARGVEQPKEHCWDVFDHSIESVGAAERLLGPAPGAAAVALPWAERLEGHFRQEVAGGRPRSVLLKLGALCHDMAKPQTKTIEAGRVRFLGHPQQGAAMAEAIMERLRFSARETRLVVTMVEQHLRPGQLGHDDDLPTRRAIYRYYRDLGDAAVDTLFLNLADFIATGAPERDPPEAQRHTRVLTHVLERGWGEQAVVKPVKLVDGHVLMGRFGLAPGPRLRHLLEAVREAQAAGEVSTVDEAIALVERLLREKDAQLLPLPEGEGEG